MLGRRHGTSSVSQVDAVRTAAGEDRGEARSTKSAPRCAAVEPDVVGAGGAIPRTTAVATTSRGASSARAWLAEHEPRAVLVDEHRPLAADRLGDQRLLAGRSVGAEPQHGRVELHELQVGHLARRPAARPRPRPRSRPWGSSSRRRPARGRRWRARPCGARRGPDPVACAFADDVQRDTADLPGRRPCSRSSDEGVLDHLDARVGRTAASWATRAREISRPGGVTAGVGDAVAQVPALAGERELPVAVRSNSVPRARRAADRGAAPR